MKQTLLASANIILRKNICTQDLICIFKLCSLSKPRKTKTKAERKKNQSIVYSCMHATSCFHFKSFSLSKLSKTRGKTDW